MRVKSPARIAHSPTAGYGAIQSKDAPNQKMLQVDLPRSEPFSQAPAFMSVEAAAAAEVAGTLVGEEAAILVAVAAGESPTVAAGDRVEEVAGVVVLE